jgi:hypothetical protein
MLAAVEVDLACEGKSAKTLIRKKKGFIPRMP